jgi:ubiquinone/menaquinone biosynthesis C-methylase UbiE
MDENAMEKDWDRRARQDAVLYVADAHRGEEFFSEGARQASALCEDFFRKEGFNPAGKRMLDIGCGIGRLERGFAEMFGEVWGLDVSGEMVTRAKELNSPFDKINFVKGNGKDLTNFQDGHFDFVFSYITFQHIPGKKIIFSYFSEIDRVLKKGGLVKVLLRRPWSGWAMVFGFIPVPRLVLRYVPGPVWSLYDRLAFRGEKAPYRGKTWRGTGVSEKEAVRFLRGLRFEIVETEPDPSGTTYWVTVKK